ncbi:hypothetical protein ABPG74_012516 [Tetrahymena malaccensis]
MNNLIFLILLCLNIQIFICSNAIFDQKQRFLKELSNQQETCLYVLLDAKSQSTRIRLYQSQCRRSSQIPVIQTLIPTNSEGRYIFPDRIQVNKQSIPLASVPVNENDLNNYFRIAFNIVNQIKKFYGTYDNIKPFLFLRASSGLRQMQQEQQENILNHVRKIFRKQEDFYFLDDSWVRLVQREEEVQYLWLSVNYAYKKIKHHPLNQFTNLNTVAVIEMGTAYSQIAYSSLSNYNKFIDLPEKTRVQIQTDTLLDYGSDTVIRSILNNEDYSNCFQKTTGFTHQLNDIYGIVEINGNYNFNNCTNLILKYMNINNCEYPLNDNVQDCSSHSKLKQLSGQKQIVGLSSIYFAKEELQRKLKLKGDTFSLKDFREQVKKYCSLTLKQQEFLENQGLFTKCIELMWISTFLIDGLGLLNNEITSVYYYQDFVLDWPFGSLLYDISKIQCDYLDLKQCSKQILLSDALNIEYNKHISKINGSQLIAPFFIIINLLIVNFLI